MSRRVVKIIEGVIIVRERVPHVNVNQSLVFD